MKFRVILASSRPWKCWATVNLAYGVILVLPSQDLVLWCHVQPQLLRYEEKIHEKKKAEQGQLKNME